MPNTGKAKIRIETDGCGTSEHSKLYLGDKQILHAYKVVFEPFEAGGFLKGSLSIRQFPGNIKETIALKAALTEADIKFTDPLQDMLYDGEKEHLEALQEALCAFGAPDIKAAQEALYALRGIFDRRNQLRDAAEREA